MEENDKKFAASSLRFVYNNELLEDPCLLNDLYLGIYKLSKCIKDQEILINSNTKQIFVFIELSFLGKKLKFIENNVRIQINEFLRDRLGWYKVKIFTEYEDFKKVKDKLIGEYNE